MTDNLYPWEPGDILTAAALNAAIQSSSGPAGPAGTSFLQGSGPPTGPAPVGTSYLDVTTGDIWLFT